MRAGVKPHPQSAFPKKAVQTTICNEVPDYVGVLGKENEIGGELVGFWMLIGLGHYMEYISAVRTEGFSVHIRKVFRQRGKYEIPFWDQACLNKGFISAP